MMLYVQDMEPDSGVWKNLLIHDTRDPREPKLILARTGELVIDEEEPHGEAGAGPRQRAQLRDGRSRGSTSRLAFKSMGFDLPVDEFFPDRKKLLLSKGDREMTLPELSREIGSLVAQGKPRSEWGRYAVEWHKKFAIPAACVVFGLLGLGLSLGSRRRRARPRSPSRSP